MSKHFLRLAIYEGPNFWMQVVPQQVLRCSGWGCLGVHGRRAASGEPQVKSLIGEERVRLQSWSQLSRKSLWKKRVHVKNLQFVIFTALNLSLFDGGGLTYQEQRTVTDGTEML